MTRQNRTDPTHRARRAADRWARRLVIVALMVGAAGATLYLKGAGERAIEGARALNEVRAELLSQNELAWQAMAGGAPKAQARADIRTSVDRVGSLVAGTTRRGLPESRANLILARQQAYYLVLSRQIETADPRGAGGTASIQAVVDPPFYAALANIKVQSRWLDERAGFRRQASNAGVLLTVGASLGMTALIQRRRQAAEIRRTEERRSEARYRALVDRSSDVVLVTDRTGRLSYLSPSAERLLSSDGTAAPEDLTDVLHAGDRDAVLAALAAS